MVSMLSASSSALLLGAALLVSAGAAYAEKPEGAGQGKLKWQSEREAAGKGQSQARTKGQGKNEASTFQAKREGSSQQQRTDGGTRISVTIGSYFQPEQRSVVQAYYGPVLQSGRCPPGLAKKNNGCLPPGLAKPYALGRPLAREVIFYDVPSSVVVQLGLPPAGHRYVRVAADILLIAVGTGMVVDAISDLGRL